MKQVELYGRVSHAVLKEGMSRRKAARVFGMRVFRIPCHGVSLDVEHVV